MTYNPELKQITANKKKKIREVTVTPSQRCYFSYCCYENKFTKSEELEKASFELMKAAEEEIKVKHDVGNLFKLFNEFRLIKKIFLNANQHYMLESRDKQFIFNKKKKGWEKDLENITQQKMEKKEDELVKYLKTNKSDLDELLFNYLSNEHKKKIKPDIL